MAVAPGEIYAHDNFYRDEAGKDQRKYLLVLAAPAKDDLIYRLLTSRQNSRPKEPCCYHGAPLPGFFLGERVCDELPEPTWLDLRRADDFDPIDFAQAVKSGRVRHTYTLPEEALRNILRCVAGADDTTQRQEARLRDVLAALPPDVA